MKLYNLLEAIPVKEIRGSVEMDIRNIRYNSNQVEPNDLFVAIKGYKSDGHTYIPAALAKGAGALVVEYLPDAPAGITLIKVPQSRQALSLLGQRFYGYPARNMKIIGITGTNGKTSISYLTNAIFEKAGEKTGIIGTIAYRIGDQARPATHTTPESLDLEQYFAEMRDLGTTCCIMEVSSHALALDRLYGVHMDGAVFTNLTRDHLDFHGTLKEYGEAKMILFEKLCDTASHAVVNVDDPFGLEIARRTPARVLTYGIKSKADIRPQVTELTGQGSHLVIDTPAGPFDLHMKLLGEFNVYNTMAALGMGLAFSVKKEKIIAGLESITGVRGRFESVIDRRGVTVVIDYAHTPDALEKILMNARRICTGKLVAVFGCGGDRDRGKRPIMGQCATTLADLVYITSDNPRTEKPEAIIDEILRGIPDQKNYIAIADRKAAIEQALTRAAKNDLVVIAGKGHEDYQIIGTQKFHFDDLEIVKNFLHIA